jgi:hypothetical protein
MRSLLAIAAGSCIATAAFYARILSDPVAIAGLAMHVCRWFW